MSILLAFAPFITFALLDRSVGPAEALAAGAVVSALLIFRDLLRPGGGVKILEAGTFLLFGGLALYTFATGATWSVIGVRLFVDTGLLLIVLASLAVRCPFTQQYAREKVPPTVWNRPEFIRTNYVITAAWAAAFLLMVMAELVLLTIPGMPRQVGTLVIVLALVGAVKFTAWYPARHAGVMSGRPS